MFGWGVGAGAAELPEWVAARPILAVIGDLVTPALQGSLDLVEVVVGGAVGEEVVEVRVGGRAVPGAECGLRARRRPRPDGPSFARSVMPALAAGS